MDDRSKRTRIKLSKSVLTKYLNSVSIADYNLLHEDMMGLYFVHLEM